MRTGSRLRLYTIFCFKAPRLVSLESESVSPQPETPSSYSELPPSDTSFLSAMDDDCVSQLERVVATLQARDIDTQNKLDHLIASLIPKSPKDAPKTNPELIGTMPVASESLKTQKVKPASPLDFNHGDWTKGLAFLHSCQTYIRLCPEDFRDEQVKILWAISYMKVDQAAKWMARIF